MPPHTERHQAGGQGGVHPGHRPGQQGLEAHRAGGEDDGLGGVVEGPEGGRV